MEIKDDGIELLLRKQLGKIILDLKYDYNLTQNSSNFILYLTLNDKINTELCQIATKCIKFIMQLMYYFFAVIDTFLKQIIF